MPDKPVADKMEKVLRWVAETMADKPERTRLEIFREAEVRFDLSPRECEFLDANFAQD